VLEGLLTDAEERELRRIVEEAAGQEWGEYAATDIRLNHYQYSGDKTEALARYGEQTIRAGSADRTPTAADRRVKGRVIRAPAPGRLLELLDKVRYSDFVGMSSRARPLEG